MIADARRQLAFLINEPIDGDLFVITISAIGYKAENRILLARL